MRVLKQAAKLAREYRRPTLSGILESHAKEIREVLVKTIAANHPSRPRDITREQYKSCKRFLSNFANVYTLNYDLLLYWALMQDEIEPKVACDDGFREPDAGPEEYVTWDVQNTNEQNIYYLHGALHLFDAGPELQKFTWSNTQVALIDQIRAALEEDKYPLFVSEGTDRSKLERIQHSGYLNRAFRSFANTRGTVFIFGFAMAGNDEHLLGLIDRGRHDTIAIGVYGDPTTSGNQQIIGRSARFGTRRKGRAPRILFFDAESACVWG